MADSRDQQTKAANDKTQFDEKQVRDQEQKERENREKSKPKDSKESKTPKSEKDPKNIQEAFEKVMDARNEFLEKIDEANDQINENSSTEQINQLRDARSDALSKFIAQYNEFKRVMEMELARQS